ncbi:MAG: hypothetical protein KKA36_01650 [Gammaproteobacteria bacterium]|nr:hypothetical protein [Gammaproteobacteria bacterium]MBU2477766.1 hypothetical protein [Gammaproteobacteria bacterium]
MKPTKNRWISAMLFLVLGLTLIGMWVMYLFVATPDHKGQHENAVDLFQYAVNPVHEHSMFFQVSLLTIFVSFTLAWLTFRARNLIFVVLFGIINAGLAVYMYQWDHGLLAAGAVIPLLLELRDA